MEGFNLNEVIQEEKMVKSMTGFGRSEYCDGKRNIIVEIKSVNHRYNDISIRMPKKYAFAEEKIKNLVKDTVKRGKVDVSVIVENITENDSNVQLNTMIAEQYYENLKILGEKFNLKDDIALSLIASLPDVLKLKPDVDDEEAIIKMMQIPVSDAVEKLDRMRSDEGRKLAEDIVLRGNIILDYVKRIEKRAPGVVSEYREKLHERINDLIGDNMVIDEERLAMETAIFADKCSITEELVRLNSHIIQLKSNVEKNYEPSGRKLDFLVQELNREVNTIGSKANDLEITKMVVDLKSEIEKIREQIQNIE